MINAMEEGENSSPPKVRLLILGDNSFTLHTIFHILAQIR